MAEAARQLQWNRLIRAALGVLLMYAWLPCAAKDLKPLVLGTPIFEPYYTHKENTDRGLHGNILHEWFLKNGYSLQISNVQINRRKQAASYLDAVTFTDTEIKLDSSLHQDFAISKHSFPQMCWYYVIRKEMLDSFDAEKLRNKRYRVGLLTVVMAGEAKSKKLYQFSNIKALTKGLLAGRVDVIIAPWLPIAYEVQKMETTHKIIGYQLHSEMHIRPAFSRLRLGKEAEYLANKMDDLLVNFPLSTAPCAQSVGS